MCKRKNAFARERENERGRERRMKKKKKEEYVALVFYMNFFFL